MPIYEYKCTNGHKFDKLIRKKSDAPKECPKCKTKEVEKTISLNAKIMQRIT